jgi:hypothetical protein
MYNRVSEPRLRPSTIRDQIGNYRVEEYKRTINEILDIEGRYISLTHSSISKMDKILTAQRIFMEVVDKDAIQWRTLNSILKRLKLSMSYQSGYINDSTVERSCVISCEKFLKQVEKLVWNFKSDIYNDTFQNQVDGSILNKTLELMELKSELCELTFTDAAFLFILKIPWTISFFRYCF